MARTTPVLSIAPVLLVIAFGLSACSSFQQQEYKRQPAPASTLAAPPSNAGSQSGAKVQVPSNSGTYPYGTAEETSEANAAAKGDSYVKGPDGSIWKGSPRDSEAHNADIEACYRYAAAQTTNDARIEQDRRAVYGDGFSDTQSVGLLNSKIRSYDHETRRRSLFSNCMRSKGYASR
ncbi:hypothetical protein [Pelagibius sp. Alg239-R121]|uniref:hypothetical protein n=1 Tax=Pelagibius sp. Alg239-R121 TaxID=2993448 RepID=UPI0024A6E2E4|nr:hypothetical protein [Pelagibius sp. Alg239-R121]